METQIIAYLLKVSLSFAVFYFLYLFCFRNDTFLKLRRIYFLAIIVFSFVFPFINIELSEKQYNIIPEFLLPAVTISADGSIVESPETMTQYMTGFSFQHAVLWIMVIVSAILFIKLIIQIISLVRLKRGLRQTIRYNCVHIYLENKSSSSFSFFNWIFLNTEEEGSNRDEIIIHEEEHAKQLHSLDVLLIELVCIILWWNPFVWMIRREMKTNLEYLADRGVVNKGYDSYTYQYTLLQTINNNAGIPLINNFNVSQLKKRIAMMNKQKTSILGSAKYFLSLPLIVGLLLINCSLSGALQDKRTVKSLDEIDSKDVKEMTVDKKNDVVIVETKEGKTYKFAIEENKETKADNENVGISSIKEGVQLQDDKPFMTVETIPSYPGGDNEMYKFIGDNLKYPESAVKENVQGRVIIRFLIDKEGNVKEPNVLKGIHPDCDAEAVRVLSMMPKWIPGKQNGKDVSVYFTLPITFKIPEKEKVQE